MFWGCFSYDHKGPHYIWKPETSDEKQKAKAFLKKYNEALEPIAKRAWELNVPMQRLGLRNKPGTKPEWKWDKAHGKAVRDGKGGIDWYRYQRHILIPLLLPFAKKCMRTRPDTVVMEDGASSHVSKHQDRVFMDAGVLRLLWCGNSPDLNMIEPCWWWMKRWITRRGETPA